jgi:hypothetical protein
MFALIAPRIVPPDEVCLLELKIIDQTAEATHLASVDVRIVFVPRVRDKIEIAGESPWTMEG